MAAAPLSNRHAFAESRGIGGCSQECCLSISIRVDLGEKWAYGANKGRRRGHLQKAERREEFLHHAPITS